LSGIEYRWSKPTVWSVEEAFGCLQSYSLVRQLESDNLWIYLLVQQVIQERLHLSRHHFSGAALRLIRLRFPWGGDLQHLSLCLEYISHAKAGIKNNSENETYAEDLALLVGSVGAYFQHDGYDEAIAQSERALRIKEKAFGVDHINTANTMNNLGFTYHSQGKYEEAISQYERALRIYEKAFGVDHIDSANTINNLGSTYYNQGKYDKAIAQYELALRIYEKVFGVDHINSADTILSIGLLLKSQGKFTLAKQTLLRAYDIFHTHLGETHPNTQNALLSLRNGWEDGGGAKHGINKKH
jgi:tetratricopeptide (TPR) repeat protein